MISILIPTYNYNIAKLVADLHSQAMKLAIEFEIIVMEDGSTIFLDDNKTVSKLEFCQHIILSKNIGRSGVRNKLADETKYEHLLFMDCDAEVCSPTFVEKYLAFCYAECVVIGGTAYHTDEHNPDFSLRLAYGRQREARTALKRGKNNFATFNFLISKRIFNQVRFDENIRGYGHEDMLFGHQLHQLGYEFIQIENPLIHKGLDSNITFIHKTEEGTRNLFLLNKTNRYPFLSEESKLLSAFLRIKRLRIDYLLGLTYDISQNILRWALCRKSPSLKLYDLYKILYICKVSQSE